MLLLEHTGTDTPSLDENQNESWQLVAGLMAAFAALMLLLAAVVAESYENEAAPFGAGRRERVPIHAGAILPQRRG